MPSRSPLSDAPKHRIAVLALDRVLPMEVGMPFHIFDRDGLPYEVLLCAPEAGPIETANGWQLVAPHGLEALATADTVIVPAFRGHADGVPGSVAEALRESHRRGARLTSICAGAFALAAAGVLAGRRVTTHWRHADELARAYPDIVVDPTVLYVDDGDIVTSAGVASGIDLCLHLLRRDHGAAVANAVAREIVAAPHREGGQAQFIERPATPPTQARLAPTLEWALTRLDRPLTVADLAAHANLSARTFARSFAAEVGITPLRWLNTARVDRARDLLETTDLTVEQITRLCGLGTSTNLREHFHQVTGTTPTEYRRAFRVGA